MHLKKNIFVTIQNQAVKCLPNDGKNARLFLHISADEFKLIQNEENKKLNRSSRK